MELDDLKIRLKSKFDVPERQKTVADLQKAIHARTKSVIGKLKRNLWIEMIFSIVMAIVLFWTASYTMLVSLQIYFGIFSFVALAFFFILLYLLRKVNSLSHTSYPVKKNLENIISVISEYMQRYFQFSMLLIPVCIIFSTWLGLHEPATNSAKLKEMIPIHFNNKSSAWVFLIFFFIGFAAFMYYFTKWYLKKLYGKYVEKLKQQLKELENE